MIDEFRHIGATRKWLPVGAILFGLTVLAVFLPSRGVGGVQGDGSLKVVVHVNFAQTSHQRIGLKNVENILKTATAEGIKAEVEVVCHGEGIRLVEKARSELAAEVVAMANQGVRFVACENTMRERSLGREDLLPSVATVPSGAFEIVIRQRGGYSYFVP
jgi:intracellular sulfur oxidation DsrE/DsrF family protein